MPNSRFSRGAMIVHPKYGVGRIGTIETQEISGQQLQLCNLEFSRQKMTLRIPLDRMSTDGIRAISGSDTVNKAIATLASPSPVQYADQYRSIPMCEERIQSGDLVAAAEVARDLYRPKTERDTPYTVELTFQLAVNRLVDEIAIVRNIPEEEALSLVLSSVADDQPDQD